MTTSLPSTATPAALPDLTTVDGATYVYHQKLDLDVRDLAKHYTAVVARMKTPGSMPPKWASEAKRLRWEKADANFGSETFRMWFAIYDKWVHLQEHAIIVMRMHPNGARWVEHAKRAKPKYLAEFAQLFLDILGRDRASRMFDSARELAVRPGGNYEPEPTNVGGVLVTL